MPISIIEKRIKKNLALINYQVQERYYKPSSNLKRSVLDDPNVIIKIRSKNSFDIYIKFSDYHEVLANNFYYNNERFKIQVKELYKLKSSTSVAWFLITMYYATFFASNEISNLAGYFNFNFDVNEKNQLFNKNEEINPEDALLFKESEINNFSGILSLCDELNMAKISCSNGGGKPHELSWNNLSKLLTLNTSNADVYARTIRLKRILKNENNWKRPNSIRNEWNYSKAELYSSHNKDYLLDLKKYFNNYTELKHWAELRRLEYRSGENDDFISIMFLLNVLGKVMEKMETFLLKKDTLKDEADFPVYKNSKQRKYKKKKRKN